MLMQAESGQRSLLHQIVRFSRALHDAGVAVNSANLIDLCRCTQHIDIGQKRDFYAASRATLVSHYNDLIRFDEVFKAFWERHKVDAGEPGGEEDQAAGSDSRAGAKKRYCAESTDTGSPGTEQKPVRVGYSPDEVLVKKDLGAMSDEELEKARRLITELVAIIANYKSRRYIPGSKGMKLNFRKMLRSYALYGADGMELFYRRRRIKKTRLMLFCDVSGSMERYSNFLIQFIYALHQGIADLDVAVFSTRITVISDFLETKSIEDSLRMVSEAVHDWAGGTNIGGCLREFNDRFAREMLRSRTVVIVLSDGWDRGDACLMREEMEHLRRRVHKILWLNPLLGSSSYQPLCRGIQTALPYLDYFLPAHNLESFARVVRHLRTVWH